MMNTKIIELLKSEEGNVLTEELIDQLAMEIERLWKDLQDGKS